MLSAIHTSHTTMQIVFYAAHSTPYFHFLCIKQFHIFQFIAIFLSSEFHLGACGPTSQSLLNMCMLFCMMICICIYCILYATRKQIQIVKCAIIEYNEFLYSRSILSVFGSTNRLNREERKKCHRQKWALKQWTMKQLRKHLLAEVLFIKYWKQNETKEHRNCS